MAFEINNKSAIKRLQEDGGLFGVQSIKPALENGVKPVLIINPKTFVSVNRAFDIIRTTTSNNAAMFTMPTNVEVYLTGICVISNSDATADNTEVSIDVVMHSDASRYDIINITKTTTTALHTVVTREFTTPIRLQAGSTIRLNNVFTVGASETGISCQIIEVEETV